MAKLHGVKTLDMLNGEITKVEYDGAVYEKVDGKSQVGDLVFSLKETSDITKGAFYLSIVNGEAEPEFIDDADDHAFLEEESAVIFRKISAQTDAFKLATNRKPKAGDFVKFTDDDELPSYLTVGKYYEITEIDFADDPQILDDDGDEYDTAGDKYEVYEKVSGATPLKVGDYAKVVNAKYITMQGFKDGDIVKIVENDFGEDDEDYRVVQITDETFEGYILKDPKYIVKATDEEVAQSNAELHKASFAKGDRAKLLSTKGALSGFSSGEIVVIESTNNSGRYEFSVSNGRTIGYTDAYNLVKLSAEEIAELTAKQAEAERWASINRKPNEFKKGDIVEVTVGYDEIKVGDIGVITIADGTDLPGVTVRGVQRYCRVNLITPVEQRFDLSGVDA